MAQTIQKDFDKYSLGYYSQHHQMDARIYLWKGNTRVATIDFIKKGQTIPKNLYDSNPGGWGIYMYFEAARFSEVLKILQTEKPLQAHIVLDTMQAGITTTGHEPVGDSEA
jgi:hypothetical protein